MLLIVRPPDPFFRLHLASPYRLWIAGLLLCLSSCALAQRQLPYLDGPANSPIAQLDFDEFYRQQIILDTTKKVPSDTRFEAGTISALDMLAPQKAIQKLKQAMSLFKAQRAQDAVHYIQKAIEIYPKFVSAHIALGLVYFDLNDGRAKDEFETATRLDDQFPISFLYLGMLSLWSKDFGAADTSLEKAAFLSPKDTQILNALAFAQNADHKYADVLRTVNRIHRLEHRGMGQVHYIAAAAALSLHDLHSGQEELKTFLNEDPSGPLSAVARQKLDEIRHGKDPFAPAAAVTSSVVPVNASVVTFPNTERLESELKSLDTSPELPYESEPSTVQSSLAHALDVSPVAPSPAAEWPNQFTIRQSVDETALFLAVSEHGRMINDLSVSDIKIRDANKPPARILQFLPQSKLPLRLGVLVDTSDSIDHRISFEKNAAKRFLDKVLNPESDLAFVAGFDTETSVTQDFTSNSAALNEGIDHLRRHGEGTAVFDAIHYACWKLAAYPDHGRVARVLVVLTDGEDNSSHRSLKQSIEAAEATGITVYTFNTTEDYAFDSDANKILRVIAERSGGESMNSQTLRDMDHYFQQLSDAIRSRYLIAYKPADFVPDGSYRTLTVTAEHDGKRLQVHVRKGYYARAGQSTDSRTAVALDQVP